MTPERDIHTQSGWHSPDSELAAREVIVLRKIREAARQVGIPDAFVTGGMGAARDEAWVDLAHEIRLRGYPSMEAASKDILNEDWIAVIDDTIRRLGGEP